MFRRLGQRLMTGFGIAPASPGNSYIRETGFLQKHSDFVTFTHSRLLVDFLPMIELPPVCDSAATAKPVCVATVPRLKIAGSDDTLKNNTKLVNHYG